MKRKHRISPPDAVLRSPTEADTGGPDENHDGVHRPAEIEDGRFIHELAEYQIELEAQKHELMKSRVELEAAYRQFTDLYDFAPVGYFVLGQDGVVLNVNLAGANLLGVERDNLLRQRLGLFLPDESRPAFQAFLEKLLDGEGKATCELMFLKEGDGEFWTHIEASCFEGGTECRAVLTDITERKRMEQALQESENRFRSMLRNVPNIAIQGYAMDGTTQYWNQASENLYGYTVGEAIGRSLLDLIIPPEMRAEVRQAIQHMAESGQPLPAEELSLMRKDGTRVTVYSSHAVVSAPGRPPELFCLDVDLSERKRMEEALRESEWRNRIVSELTTDYIFVVDVEKDGGLKLRWASDNMLRLTGRTVADAATSELWGNIIHPDDAERFFGFAQQILSTGEAGELECRTFHKQGNERWIRIFARPQAGDGGRVATIVGAIKDITERRRAEEELRYLGTHDALTGLYNRSFFEEEVTRLERGREFPVSIVMADVDHLKITNDRDGHAAGDEILRRAAYVLVAAFRAEDVIARIGGDEFAVLLPATDAAAAELSLQRVRQLVAENNAGRFGPALRLSLGASTAGHSVSLTSALQEADTRMYRDKRGENSM
ncbi:MAG: PAS domain S-box protein [Chloroflexi bacterium]|nr:PAS domain S-box protein [Chloroflexota bacterium]